MVLGMVISQIFVVDLMALQKDHFIITVVKPSEIVK